MLARHLFVTAPLAIVTTFVGTGYAFAQTDLKAAVVSLTKDIHADADAEKLKGAKIFIAPFENRKAKKDDTVNVLIDMLSTEFINKKHFKVVERAQVDKALKELAFGESGFVDAKTAKQLGKLVGAEYALIGSISEVESTTLISVRLVSVETGEAVVAAEVTPGIDKSKTLVIVPKPEPKPVETTVPPPGPDNTGKIAMNPIDKAELVYVPAGEFTMGTKLQPYFTRKDGSEYPYTPIYDGQAVRDYFFDAKPLRKVYLDGYWIYKYPVTIEQYKKFCQATGHQIPEPWQKEVDTIDKTNDDRPIFKVSWDDAMAYCKWAGVTLPTEAQWEKAARGTDGRLYSWGNNFDDSKLLCSIKTNRPFGSVHREIYKSESPYGCVDMVGNVAQWCLDWYMPDYYQVAPNRNPKGPESGRGHVIRGDGTRGSKVR